MRTDDRLLQEAPFLAPDHGPLSQWLPEASCCAGSDEGPSDLTAAQHCLARVTAALCAHPLVLTNATELWVSAVHSLLYQRMSVGFVGPAPEAGQPDLQTPVARRTLLVEDCVAVILSTNTTMEDLALRIEAAQARPEVKAVLCAGVQSWFWHLTNEAHRKPVHGVRLVHVVQLHPATTESLAP